MTEWTAPKTFVAGETFTSGEANTHIRDNLLFLHAAKHGRFGRLAALDVPTSTFVGVAWDFAVEQSPVMWSASTQPSRVQPPLPGVWLVHSLIRWEASTASGTRALRLQKNGATILSQERQSLLANATQYISATATVRLNGADYVTAEVWQNTGATETLASSVDRSISLTWLGA